jgi:hypothetical protein
MLANCIRRNRRKSFILVSIVKSRLHRGSAIVIISQKSVHKEKPHMKAKRNDSIKVSKTLCKEGKFEVLPIFFISVKKFECKDCDKKFYEEEDLLCHTISIHKNTMDR